LVAEDDQARVVGFEVGAAEPGVRADSGKESVRVVAADQEPRSPRSLRRCMRYGRVPTCPPPSPS
jgi:hypothetical protein